METGVIPVQCRYGDSPTRYFRDLMFCNLRKAKEAAMAEIFSSTFSFGDPRLRAWRVELDFTRWQWLLKQAAGVVPHAVLRFSQEITAGLTGFIAELKVDNQHQLLRPYQYELPAMGEAVAHRQAETDGLDGVGHRAAAAAIGISRVHGHFRSRGQGSQAILMSPVNEASGQPEFLHTAVYFLAYENGAVNGWQLFVDFSAPERQQYMAWVARRAGTNYSAQTDLDLAAAPVLSADSSGQQLYSSVEDFIADAAGFLKTGRGRASISDISLENPGRFVADQMRLEDKNRQEAESWVEPYIRAIAQGSIDLGRRIITKLQLKVLNLTESAVRSAARLAAVDFSALQVFLRACGFLPFSFSPETSIVSPQSFFAAPVIAGHCQEKICRQCGTHAGDRDTKCPSCGWSP